MNSILRFSHSHLELFLLIVAVAQIGLAGLSLCLPRILHWKPAIESMPLLVREVFEIHSWFIALTLVIWGALTLAFAGEMARSPNSLSRALCGAIGIFWGIRCVLQWFHYSPSHWRGDRKRTVIHWTLFLGYLAWAATYFLAAFWT